MTPIGNFQDGLHTKIPRVRLCDMLLESGDIRRIIWSAKNLLRIFNGLSDGNMNKS